MIGKTEGKLSSGTVVQAPCHLQASYCILLPLFAIMKNYLEGCLSSRLVSQGILSQWIAFQLLSIIVSGVVGSL